MIELVDHLAYATPDVDAACAELEQRLGVRASAGGQHQGRGTRNALIAIGPRCYLEIIGPDHSQPLPAGPRWFGVDEVKTPRLVAWCVAASSLSSLASDAREHGVPLGTVSDGRRARPDGVVLTWQVTDPTVMLGDGLVPFYIDWGSTPHPASTAVEGPRLVGLRGEHPDPTRIGGMLSALAITMPVDEAGRPALVATFENGVELR